MHLHGLAFHRPFFATADLVSPFRAQHRVFLLAVALIGSPPHHPTFLFFAAITERRRGSTKHVLLSADLCYPTRLVSTIGRMAADN